MLWVLDNNVLSFVLRARADDGFADALGRVPAAHQVATVEHVLGELKRDGELWQRWKASRLRDALEVLSIDVNSPEERHYDAMRRPLDATRGTSNLRDLGERACIAVCTTRHEAIFVSHDAGSLRLAVGELAQNTPALGRAATIYELLRWLAKDAALTSGAVDAIMDQVTPSKRLAEPSWWRAWRTALAD